MPHIPPDRITPAKELMYARKDVHEKEIANHLDHITREFKEGFEFVRKYPKSVTIFGSSIAPMDLDYCKEAELFAGRLVRELGYAVLTGGGAGVMGAASKGAYEAGGDSIGLNISLPHERQKNQYLTANIKFSYFFSRKTLMAFAAEAYVFFPGGYGTLDELFGILTLLQTGKIPHIPVLLFDSSYWKPLDTFIKKTLGEIYKTIDPKDAGLYEITDSVDRLMEVVRKAPVHEWSRNIN